MVDNYEDILQELFNVIKSRRTADRANSYVAGQFAGGPGRIGQKVGEEAVEAQVRIPLPCSRGEGEDRRVRRLPAPPDPASRPPSSLIPAPPKSFPN